MAIQITTNPKTTTIAPIMPGLKSPGSSVAFWDVCVDPGYIVAVSVGAAWSSFQNKVVAVSSLRWKPRTGVVIVVCV